MLFETETIFTLITEIPLSQAVTSPQSGECKSTIANEMKSIPIKDTWDLVDRPEIADAIGSCFVLDNKYGTDGVLERCEAGIVAKSYSQKYGKN